MLRKYFKKALILILILQAAQSIAHPGQNLDNDLPKEKALPLKKSAALEKTGKIKFNQMRYILNQIPFLESNAIKKIL